jgi:hypothetical protein
MKLLELAAKSEGAYADYHLECDRLFRAASEGDENARRIALKRKDEAWGQRLLARSEMLAFIETLNIEST